MLIGFLANIWCKSTDGIKLSAGQRILVIVKNIIDFEYYYTTSKYPFGRPGKVDGNFAKEEYTRLVYQI